MPGVDSLIASGLAALAAGRQTFDAWFDAAWPLDAFLTLALAPVDATPYTRLVLANGQSGEAMLATWRVDGKSAIHDHGGADGAVIILAGDFIETHFQLRAGTLRSGKSLSYRAGEVARVTPHSIHDMHAPQGGLTLHLYAPQPQPVRLFDPELRRTVTVASGAGAWLPARPEHVVAIEPWEAA
jgi:hypothetical protein